MLRPASALEVSGRSRSCESCSGFGHWRPMPGQASATPTVSRCQPLDLSMVTKNNIDNKGSTAFNAMITGANRFWSPASCAVRSV
jgi:hypothetical protein